jgi:hypothetical protein
MSAGDSFDCGAVLHISAYQAHLLRGWRTRLFGNGPSGHKSFRWLLSSALGRDTPMELLDHAQAQVVLDRLAKRFREGIGLRGRMRPMTWRGVKP